MSDGMFGRLFKNAAIYSIGGALGKVVGFLMIPVYTHYLTPDDYGVLSLVLQFGFLVMLLMEMGITQSMVHFYFQAKTEEDKDRFVTVAFGTVLGFAALFITSLYVVAERLSELIFNSTQYSDFIRISLVSLVCQFVVNAATDLIRTEQKAKLFVLFELGTLVVALSLNIYFVVYLQVGIKGILLSTVYTQGFFALLLLGYLARRFRFRYDFKLAKRMLAYSLPVMGAYLGMLVLHFSDHFLLGKYDTLNATGNYALAYRYGQIVALLIFTPFQGAWSPKQFEMAQEGNQSALFSNIATYCLLVITFGSLALSLLINDIFKIMVDRSFHEAAQYVPAILLSYVFYGMYTHYQFGLLVTEKTRFFGILTVLTAVLTIVLNVVLIPYMSVWGAALATVIANIVLFFSIYVVSQSYYKIPLQWARAAKILGTACVLYGISFFYPIDTLVWSLCLQSFLILCYPVVLFALKTFREDEIEVVRSYAVSFLPKRHTVVKPSSS